MPAACSANPACAHLVGDCCPNQNGVKLDCCAAGPAPAASPSTSPATAVPPPPSSQSPAPPSSSPSKASPPLPKSSPSASPPPLPPAAPGQPLLGGTALGGKSLQWPSADPHPLQPTEVWGGAKAPLPTNAWWQNLVLDEGGTLGENVIYPLPYLAQAKPDGLHVSLPAAKDYVASVDFVIVPVADAVGLGAKGELGKRTVTAHDPLSVTVRWPVGGDAHFETPLVRGAPYVTALYSRAAPRLTFASAALLKVDGATPNGKVSGARFVLQAS